MSVTTPQMPDSAARVPRSAFSLLAWAGWRLEMPGEWQPLKLSGTPAKGQMMLGDSVCALFSIHWERLTRGTISDGRAWVTGRIKRHGVLPDETPPPAAENFSACGWAHGVQSEEDKQTTYWYGYAASAELLMGVIVNGVLPAAVRQQVIGEVLPSLRATPADTDSIWSMYDVGFAAPAGFELRRRHLYSGDVALEFARGRHETLLLRQVYPGDLALGRRPFERWLDACPFKEYRRLRRTGATIEPWQHRTRTELAGVRRAGRKRLPWPLGGVSPRWSSALAVHDRRLNRLLIAEHVTAGEPEQALGDRAVGLMNVANAACGTRNSEDQGSGGQGSRRIRPEPRTLSPFSSPGPSGGFCASGATEH